MYAEFSASWPLIFFSLVVGSHSIGTMSKNRLITCPGCDHGFMEGRSLSQHLTRSIECKRVVNASRGRDHNGVVAAVAPEPNVPMDLKDDDDSSVAPPNEYDDDTCTTVGSNAESHVSHNEEALVESNLLEVVTFPTAYTNSARHEVKLLKLLLDIGAPNYAFQSFMEWGRQSRMDDYHFQPQPQRFESQISNLTELVGMKGCRPTAVPVTLEPDGLTLDVIVFPFATMLSSLFNCPKLNKAENLVVNPLNRFGRFRSSDGAAGEVNSAQWYQDTYDQVIKDPDKEFLAPIIFTMDKTVISEASHLSVYVILFTTSIYNREVCVAIDLAPRSSVNSPFAQIVVDPQYRISLEALSVYPGP